MKTILIIIVAIFLSNNVYATELSWVDEQIEAIKPPRKGVNIRGSIYNPFIFLEKNKTKKKDRKKASSVAKIKKAPSKSAGLNTVVCDTDANKKDSGRLLLSTIINSSAMINGSWYKKSDKIKGYSIVEVTKTSVTLKKGDKQLILSTNVTKPNLKFKNK